MSYENQNEHILANLALHLGKPQGHRIGEYPSDEELAAMADNRLDAVRRAQIMSYIANDASCYQRWIAVVQAVSDFATATSASTAHVRSREPGVLSKLAKVLFGNSLRAGMLGGGFASAAAVLVVVLFLPSLNDMTRIDGAYDQWSSDIANQWDSTAHRRKLPLESTRAFKARLEPETILVYGYQSGALTLGASKYETLGIQLDQNAGEKPSRSKTLSSEHYNSLLALGRLTALTTLQCELKQVNSDFSMIFKTARHLTRQLRNISDKKMSELVAKFPQQPMQERKMTDKDVVCQFTDSVIRTIY